MSPRQRKLGRQGPIASELPLAASHSPAEAAEASALPAPPTVVHAPCAGADVLELRADLLAADPFVPTTLYCAHALSGAEFRITTSRSEHAAAMAAGVPVFTAAELCALAAAVSVDRAWAPTLGDWLDAKRQTPGYYLTRAITLGECTAGPDAFESMTIGRVFSRLGVSLRGVTMED